MSVITPDIFRFIAHWEGIVLEPYLDSCDVWTWGMGVTEASGYPIMQYKGNPATPATAISVSAQALQKRYLRPVQRAFKGRDLDDTQLAAALSFHWNTGAIERTNWVKLYNKGDLDLAEVFLRNHYTQHGLLQKRRSAEADLFFHGEWPNDMSVVMYPVDKRTYHPDFRKGVIVRLDDNLLDGLGEGHA